MFTNEEKEELHKIVKHWRDRLEQVGPSYSSYGARFLGELQTSSFKNPNEGLKLIENITADMTKMNEAKEAHDKLLNMYADIIRKLEE